MMSDITNNSAAPAADPNESSEQSDHQKIDKVLDELDVSTTSSGGRPDR
jgi:hypothetical protein